MPAPTKEWTGAATLTLFMLITTFCDLPRLVGIDTFDLDAYHKGGRHDEHYYEDEYAYVDR